MKKLELQLPARQRIERPEGLVEKQYFRVNGEGAGDADALLHAAGKPSGTAQAMGSPRLGRWTRRRKPCPLTTPLRLRRLMHGGTRAW